MALWNDAANGPLAGLRVIDMSTTLMGPYASLLLAQMGADVIKVEAPGGDIARYIGDNSGAGLGPAFLNLNRGKRSVVVDLGVDEERELLLELAASADILSHNLRPRVAARHGLTYEALAIVNPRLVVCNMYGFGQDGPWAERPAYDDVVQGAAGTAAIQGEQGGSPTYVKSTVVDKTVGLMAATAMLAALYERDRSGLGQAVDIPMFESMVAMNAMEQLGGFVFDPPRGPSGYSRTRSPHRRPYATRDGYLSVVVYTDRQWRAFFDLAGRRDLVDDPRFITIRERTENIDLLYASLADVLRTRTSQEWLEVFSKADIPAMPVLGIEDLLSNDQVLASGLFESVEHPTVGALRQPGLGWRFSRTTADVAGPAPLLGEHNDNVKMSAGKVTR